MPPAPNPPAADDAAAPGGPSRYRCTACGNLTRFDVTSTRRSRAYHHFTVGGELEVEDEVVLEDTVEEVSCRWCGSPANVVRLDPDEVAGDAG